MNPIQWYPGHMIKARRMIVEDLKLIDVVIELVDARAPNATRNPDFDDLFAQKVRVIILNKSDLADPAKTRQWSDYYSTKGYKVLEFVSTNNEKKAKAFELIEKAAQEKVKKLKEKGISKTVRAMVVGIPNVGKSTFINRISGRQSTAVANRPGVTKGKQWVKISAYLELMDTPGMLWPKFSNKNVAQRLAYIGSIRDAIMDTQQLSMQLLVVLNKLCPHELQTRYKQIMPDMSAQELLDAVCRSRGFIISGGKLDYERASITVLDEFRAGKIAKVTLETPSQVESETCVEGIDDE